MHHFSKANETEVTDKAGNIIQAWDVLWKGEVVGGKVCIMERRGKYGSYHYSTIIRPAWTALTANGRGWEEGTLA